MPKTWTEYDVVNQHRESTHGRPWMLNTREKAEKWARGLLNGARNPEASYTVIEKRCKELCTYGPEQDDDQ